MSLKQHLLSIRFCLMTGFMLLLMPLQAQVKYGHLDSLKGYYSGYRAWWDVRHYGLHVDFAEKDSSVRGYNDIRYRVLIPKQELQLDLLEPMQLDSVVQDKQRLTYRKDGPAYFVALSTKQVQGAHAEMRVYFHGKPKVAVNPPWDGGIVWKKDANQKPWISVACQGMAARVWFPNKDHMADEADSADMYFSARRDLICVSNGRLVGVNDEAGKLVYHWQVVNPINNYNIIPYIGNYVNISDTIMGVKGILPLNYWVLAGNYDKAKQHFQQAKQMLHCFEDWFGPYPYYEDGYKLVEAPYLGMEHQSATAYGNKYMNGYLGRDLSFTGWGLKWDFIIVHESGHEWFGNNISAKDVADNWIHESFTAYSENLYVECLFGKQAGAEYVIGTRKAILNTEKIIGDYDVNNGSSGDLYYKGANVLHMIRQMCGNDSLWKAMLRGMNSYFWHQTVDSKQVEDYMRDFLKLNLGPVFDQYLRQTKVPVLAYYFKKGQLYYCWQGVLKGFVMPVKVSVGGTVVILPARDTWQKIKTDARELQVDVNYYVQVKREK